MPSYQDYKDMKEAMRNGHRKKVSKISWKFSQKEYAQLSDEALEEGRNKRDKEDEENDNCKMNSYNY